MENLLFESLTQTTRHVAGVAEMKIARGRNQLVVTHAIGSCIAIALYDPVAIVGGILHFMLPDSSVNPQRAATNLWMFADTAVPAFFEKAYEFGARKERMVLKAAGGAQFREADDLFAVGKRNYLAMKKLLWKEGLVIAAESIGGTKTRTLYLDLQNGKTWYQLGGKEIEL